MALRYPPPPPPPPSVAVVVAIVLFEIPPGIVLLSVRLVSVGLTSRLADPGPSPFVVGGMPFVCEVVMYSFLMALEGTSVWGVGFSTIVLAEPEPWVTGVYWVTFCWTGVAVAYAALVESGSGLRAVCLPRRWIGWFGFAQGVCSRNCCSEEDVVAAAAAEVERADAVVGFGKVVGW